MDHLSERATADLEWWQGLVRPFGWTVFGWTYQATAQVTTQNGDRLQLDHAWVRALLPIREKLTGAPYPAPRRY